jgi:predicted Zn-dependent protease
LRIVYALAGRGMPAAAYVDVLQPDWQTLREVWARYRQFGTRQDLEDLAAYAATVTERDTLTKGNVRAAHLWLFQAEMHEELGRQQEVLACLEKAYRLGPHVYPIRLALGRTLMKEGRFAEAEPHVRWCLARRPENKGLSAALVEITKQRFAQRSADDSK